jgi:hypothetical protein
MSEKVNAVTDFLQLDGSSNDATTFSLKTLNIMTLSIDGLITTDGMTTLGIRIVCHYAKCRVFLKLC